MLYDWADSIRNYCLYISEMHYKITDNNITLQACKTRGLKHLVYCVYHGGGNLYFFGFITK